MRPVRQVRVANPYWNAPAQALLDPGGEVSAVLNDPGRYRHRRECVYLSIRRVVDSAVTDTISWRSRLHSNRSPAIATERRRRLRASIPYRAEQALLRPPGDPRYPYGSPGGSSYDARTCGESASSFPINTRDSSTIWARFVQPSQLLGHLRISYDFTPKINATVTFANLLSTCFGGQQTAFTYFWEKQRLQLRVGLRRCRQSGRQRLQSRR